MNKTNEFLFQDLLKEINNTPGSWADAGRVAASHLNDPYLNRKVKFKLAMAAGHLQEVEYWVMDNGSSEEILEYMNIWSPEEKVLVHIAKTREDLSWELMEEILVTNHRIGWMLRAEFVKSLNLALIEKYLVQILAVRESLLSLHFYTHILDYAREKYQLGDGVPDEWVERMLIGDPKTARKRIFEVDIETSPV